MTETTYFGANVERREDVALLTGRGQYVDDIAPVGTLTAHFVRSPHPHARITHIDTVRARAHPGVHAVITSNDLPTAMQKAFPLLVPNPNIKQALTYPPLAKDEACYTGQPVAVIVADERAIGEDAAELLGISYELLPAVSDCRVAVRDDAPTAHLEAPDNVAAVFTVGFGDIDAAFATAPNLLQESIWQHRGAGHAMEGRGVLAVHDPIDGSLTVWSSTQVPYLLKDVVGRILELDDTKIRAVAPDVGGGFGPKAQVYQEEILVPWLARYLCRPVKWVEDRYEQATTTTQERDQFSENEVAFDNDGIVLVVRVAIIHDQGAFMPWGIITPIIGATTLPGPYILHAYTSTTTVALTNKVGTSPLRGTGRPQAVFVMERLMDRIAEHLSLDPAEVRERNMIHPEQQPYQIGLVGRDGSPVTYDSGDYPKCQAIALQQADYAHFRERQTAALAEGRYLGIGIANVVEATGLGPHEGAEMRVLSTGKLGIFTGAASQGQSHKTVLTQVAADAFGTDIDQIEVTAADTARFPVGVGTFASRVAVLTGSAVHNAATELRGKVLTVAARHLNIDQADLEIVPGAVQIAKAKQTRLPERADHEITLARLLQSTKGTPGFTSPDGEQPGLAVTNYFTPSQSTFSNATHVVEVEVDIELGRVEIVRYVVGHDCGRMINPMIVEGQIQGGVAHGIGNALYEFMDYDALGNPQTVTLEEYLLPAALDVPKVEIVTMQSPSPLNPLGIKGAGESGTIPAAAAIISAVENALRPLGVHIQRQPIDAQHLVELITAATAQPGATTNGPVQP